MLRCYFSCATLVFTKSRLSAASLMAAGLRVLINRKGLYSSLNPSCTVRVYYSVHAFWRSPATHTALFPWPARHSVSRMSCSMLVRPKAISVFIFSALKQDCSKSLAIRLVHSSLSGGGRRRRPPELLVGHLSWAVPLARSEGFLGREALPTPRGVWSSALPASLGPSGGRAAARGCRTGQVQAPSPGTCPPAWLRASSPRPRRLHSQKETRVWVLGLSTRCAWSCSHAALEILLWVFSRVF